MEKTPIGAQVLGDAMGSSMDSYGTFFSNLRLLNESSDPINSIHYHGICGETCAHISAYKSDLQLLDVILKNGFNPNVKNHKGDTIVHIATRLGDLDSLKLIYSSGKCDLDILNADGLSALDLSRSLIKDSEIFELRMFRHWNSSDPNDISTASIMKGRKACEHFLAEKVVSDRFVKTNQIMEDTIAFNKNRTAVSRIIRGINAIKNFRSYSDLSYPNSDTSREDILFFEKGWGFAVGFKLVVTRVFALEYVHRSMNVGFHNVVLRSTRK